MKKISQQLKHVMEQNDTAAPEHLELMPDSKIAAMLSDPLQLVVHRTDPFTTSSSHLPSPSACPCSSLSILLSLFCFFRLLLLKEASIPLIKDM